MERIPEKTPLSPYSMDVQVKREAASPLLSPQSLQHSTPEPPAAPTAQRLRIDALLNPVSSSAETSSLSLTPLSRLQLPVHTPPTPSSYADGGSSRSTPFQQDPIPQRSTPSSIPSSNKSKKRAKNDRTVAQVKQPVNFYPKDDHDSMMAINYVTRGEVERGLRHFSVKPSGCIYDYPKTYPYSSSKKSIFHQTAKKGFEVFEYSFRMPEDPLSAKPWVVMWDYQVGLVRMTAFFKALGFRKTVPKEAIAENPPLIEYCLSVTGGALDAQGYWMPYNCARALCATFCYNIRWALVPVFGINFINDCLLPDHPNYQKWKIDPNLVRHAATAAVAWNSQPTVPSVPPAHDHTRDDSESDADRRPKLRHRKTATTTFPNGSDSEDGRREPEYVRSRADSLQLSPKSRPVPAWTSINAFQNPSRRHNHTPTQLPPPSHKRRRAETDFEEDPEPRRRPPHAESKGFGHAQRRPRVGPTDPAVHTTPAPPPQQAQYWSPSRPATHHRSQPRQRRVVEEEHSEDDDRDMMVRARLRDKSVPLPAYPATRVEDPETAAEILLALRHSNEYFAGGRGY